MAHHKNFDKQIFRYEKSILPFEWMICVKYNQRYDLAFIDRHDVLTICKFRFEAFSFPYVLCLTNNASYKETYGNT